MRKVLALLVLFIGAGVIYFNFGNPLGQKTSTGFISSNTDYSFTPPVSATNFTPVEKSQLYEIANRYINSTEATLGIGIKNLTTGEEFYYHKEMPFRSASLYKLIVLYGVFYEAQRGRLDITNPTIKNQMEQMITVSSNEAAIALAQRISWEKLDEIAKSIGMKNTSMYNPITTTPEDMTNLIYLIATDRALDPNSSMQMRDIMLRQRLNDRIPALLPDIPIAHKTGELDDVLHDAGIVYGPKNTYLITLMSKDNKTYPPMKQLMAEISRDIYQYFEQ